MYITCHASATDYMQVDVLNNLFTMILRQNTVLFSFLDEVQESLSSSMPEQSDPGSHANSCQTQELAPSVKRILSISSTQYIIHMHTDESGIMRGRRTGRSWTENVTLSWTRRIQAVSAAQAEASSRPLACTMGQGFPSLHIHKSWLFPLHRAHKPPWECKNVVLDFFCAAEFLARWEVSWISREER